jgi:hypothetical protein
MLVQGTLGTSFEKQQLRRLWCFEKPKEEVNTKNNIHISFKMVRQDGSLVQFKRNIPL